MDINNGYTNQGKTIKVVLNHGKWDFMIYHWHILALGY